MLTVNSLETLANLFQACPNISEINLKANRIGGGQHSANHERDGVDYFLMKMCTELYHPKTLDLSYNNLTDACLYPVVKYIFANHENKLETFNLENN
jgi:hypothetical protein